MARRDWIPSREQDFVDLCKKWKRILEDPAKVTAYGWDPLDIAAILAAIDAFLAAREAYEADNSTSKRMIKDDAKEESIDLMRDFANTSVRFNKKMSDAAKLEIGIHPQDSTPTHHARPESQPDIVVENTTNHFEHRIRALNHETGKPSKPTDAYGVRYAWQIGGERPASGEDLPKTKFNRRATLIITHTEAEKGKIAYYSVCYENSRGETGPWSPIEEGVIG